MHPIDAGALIILGVSLIRGLRRGLWRSLFDVARTLAAYWAAYRYASPLAGLVARHVGVSGGGAVLLGAVLAFLGVQVAAGVLEFLLFPPRRKGRRHGGPSRFLGGLLGATVGAVAVVACCWLYGVARTSAWGHRLPDPTGSRAMLLSREVFARGAYVLLRGRVESPDQARRMALSLSDPERLTVSLRAVVQRPTFARVLEDSSFVRVVRLGDRDAILHHPRLAALLEDAQTMRDLQRLGIVPEGWSTPEFKAELAGRLAVVGTRIEDLLSDPAAQEALEKLQEEDLLRPERIPELLVDRRFLTLLGRVLRGPLEEPETRSGG